jgi:hypothetical protein
MSRLRPHEKLIYVEHDLLIRYLTGVPIRNPVCALREVRQPLLKVDGE